MTDPQPTEDPTHVALRDWFVNRQREIDEAWVVAYDTQDVQDMQHAEELGDDFHFECRDALAKLLGIEG